LLISASLKKCNLLNSLLIEKQGDDDEIISRIAPILSKIGGCFSSSNHLLYRIIDRYVVDGFSCDGKRLFAIHRKFGGSKLLCFAQTMGQFSGAPRNKKVAQSKRTPNAAKLCAALNFAIRMTPFPGDYEGPVVAIKDMSAFTAHLMDGTREASRKGFINKDSNCLSGNGYNWSLQS
jgi:hypothetical protein